MGFAAHILILILTAQVQAPKASEPWILSYECDSAWGELTEEVCGANPFVLRTEQFETKQQAINWANENYVFAPLTLKHGEEFLRCESNYIDSESIDVFRAHHKEVACEKAGAQWISD